MLAIKHGTVFQEKVRLVSNVCSISTFHNPIFLPSFKALKRINITVIIEAVTWQHNWTQRGRRVLEQHKSLPSETLLFHMPGTRGKATSWRLSLSSLISLTVGRVHPQGICQNELLKLYTVHLLDMGLTLEAKKGPMKRSHTGSRQPTFQHVSGAGARETWAPTLSWGVTGS